MYCWSGRLNDEGAQASSAEVPGTSARDKIALPDEEFSEKNSRAPSNGSAFSGVE